MVGTKNPLCEFEDVHKQNFVAKFDENQTLPGKVGLISANRGRKSEEPKLESRPINCPRKYGIFMKLWKGHLLMNIVKFMQDIIDLHCQSKDMVDIHNLRGKLGPVTLKC